MRAYLGRRGEDEFSAEGILHGKNFPWRGKFRGGKLSRGNSTPGEYARVPIRNLCMYCFLFADSILHVDILKVVVRGKFPPGLNCTEDISVGRSIFLGKWSQIPYPPPPPPQHLALYAKVLILSQFTKNDS